MQATPTQANPPSAPRPSDAAITDTVTSSGDAPFSDVLNDSLSPESGTDAADTYTDEIGAPEEKSNSAPDTHPVISAGIVAASIITPDTLKLQLSTQGEDDKTVAPSDPATGSHPELTILIELTSSLHGTPTLIDGAETATVVNMDSKNESFVSDARPGVELNTKSRTDPMLDATSAKQVKSALAAIATLTEKPAAIGLGQMSGSTISDSGKLNAAIVSDIPVLELVAAASPGGKISAEASPEKLANAHNTSSATSQQTSAEPMPTTSYEKQRSKSDSGFPAKKEQHAGNTRGSKKAAALRTGDAPAGETDAARQEKTPPLKQPVADAKIVDATLIDDQVHIEKENQSRDAIIGKIENNLRDAARRTVHPTSRTVPRGAVQAAWLRSLLDQASRPLSNRNGWKMLEMKLDDGEGTMTVKTRREADHVAVAVAFSDPKLRDLAHQNMERLHEALKQQYETAVELSLTHDDSGAHQRQGSPHANSGNMHLNGQGGESDVLDHSAPTREVHAGARHVWVG